jgi:hypothetical protein
MAGVALEDGEHEQAPPSIESRSRLTRKAVAKRTVLSSSMEPRSGRAIPMAAMALLQSRAWRLRPLFPNISHMAAVCPPNPTQPSLTCLLFASALRHRVPIQGVRRKRMKSKKKWLKCIGQASMVAYCLSPCTSVMLIQNRKGFTCFPLIYKQPCVNPLSSLC